MNKKRALVNLYKDIVLVTRVRIFYTALFTNNNIKVVIQIDAFLAHLFITIFYLSNELSVPIIGNQHISWKWILCRTVYFFLHMRPVSINLFRLWHISAWDLIIYLALRSKNYWQDSNNPSFLSIPYNVISWLWK